MMSPTAVRPRRRGSQPLAGLERRQPNREKKKESERKKEDREDEGKWKDDG